MHTRKNTYRGSDKGVSKSLDGDYGDRARQLGDAPLILHDAAVCTLFGGGSCQQVRQGLFVPTHHRPLASHGDGTAPQTRLPGQECDPLLVAQFLTGQTQLPKAAASGGNQIPHASRQELSQLANLILRRHVRVVTALRYFCSQFAEQLPGFAA